MLQNILDGPELALNQHIPIHTIRELDIPTSDLFETFDHARPLGISPGFSEKGRLNALAVADDKNCRIIEFTQPKSQRGGNNRPPPGLPQAPRDVKGRTLLEDKILCRPVGDLLAFDIGPLSMSLYCDTNLRITNAVDIQSAFSAVDRKPLTAIKQSVGEDIQVKKENIVTLFSNPVYSAEDRKSTTDLAMRAWVAQFLAGYGNGAETFEKVPRIDTKKLSSLVLDMIGKIANDAQRLDHLKPHQQTHRIQGSHVGSQVNSASYGDKFRAGKNVRVQLQNEHGTYVTPGITADVEGRSANLNTRQTIGNNAILKVITIGRDDPTTAEAQRAATVLRILQGSGELLNDSPWIQNIWFPPADGLPLVWPKEWKSTTKPSRLPPKPPSPSSESKPPLSLNGSQQKAVNAMMSPKDDHRIVLVQGPPGTGKTSVIAAYVHHAVEKAGQGGIWLVTQSNVAVKNIAEKLISSGFSNWRLLVSKDFHCVWHEHLYHKVQANMIRSDEFGIIGPSRFKGCQVMLCTLSMLSNRSIPKFTHHIPMKSLIVDEASQIEVGNYISVFSTFQSLRKACFIGDDKQLPPYGQEDLQDLQSIFEISHLNKHVVFLDTQYRMPPQIGDIISEAVYDAKLKSNPLHPITEKTTACYFINVQAGKERKMNDSFKNEAEMEAVIKLAQKLQDQEKNYRIITPYLLQRSTIENYMMSVDGLDWKDKCFAVDSFQGNEEDYIIISLVRSRELGFLNNLRRTNVMLTRCKLGMFIVTSKQFLEGPGSKCLVGTLKDKFGPEAWLTMEDIEEERF